MLDYLLLSFATYGAAAISGAAGFGGALLLLPLLVGTVGATEAVPLLTVAQFVGNLSRAGLGLSQIHWRPVLWFLSGALPLSILGALAFIGLPKDLVIRCIGGCILLFVALRQLGVVKVKTGPLLLVSGGGAVGFLSGLVGSAGPLGAAIFLSLGLPPVAYVASEAVTALAMHGLKTVVYHRYLPLPAKFWLLAALMGGTMFLGTWSAKRVIEQLPREKFHRYVTGLLVAIALYMLIHG